MKRIVVILTVALTILLTVCLLAGLPISTAVSYCIAGGLLGTLIALDSTRLTRPEHSWTRRHPFSSLLILQVLTASCALMGMIAETQLLDHFGYSYGGLTLLLWPVGVLVALLVMTTSALESLQTTKRRVAAYSLAVVISMMQMYWHVFYLINKYGT